MSVSDLLQRLQAQAVGAPMDWMKIREDIHAEHERATTTAERSALLGIHKAVMDSVERGAGFAPEDLAAFKETRRKDYCLLLIQEATIGDNSGNINPQRMAEITQREVEAGRMAPDDDLHTLAVAGATILAPLPTAEKKQPVRTTLVVRLGNVLYWLGSGVACAIVAVGGVEAYANSGPALPLLFFALLAAVLVWLVGRACRYVLTGN